MTSTIPNFRDVGGVAGLDGARVRTGRLLRSALPSADDTPPRGSDWPPSLVLDLRSPAEQLGDHPLLPLGPRVVTLSLLQALRPGWHEDTATLSHLYGLVLDEAGHLLVRLVDEVAHADGPVLVHCAAGKDRTGISVALVLRLLGVSRDDVVADYLLTGQATAQIDARLQHDRAERPPLPTAFYAVPPEAIEGVLDRWDAHDGGVEGWFTDRGGSAASLGTLRDSMLGS